MRKFLVMLCAAAMMFVSANVANACTQQDPGCPTGTWTDTFTPAQGVFFGTGGVSSYSFTHDITDGVNGYEPLKDSVLKGSLSLYLQDDCQGRNDCSGRFPEDEWVLIDLPLVSYDQWVEIDLAPINLSLQGNILAMLNTTGQLTINLVRISGDFYFNKSVLTVEGCDFSTVPEPATLLLLGGGLIGLVGYGRKKISK